MIDPGKLQEGARYKVTHRLPTQRKERESVMTYLGTDSCGALQFDARPFAGTQTFFPAWIVSIKRTNPSMPHRVGV